MSQKRDPDARAARAFHCDWLVEGNRPCNRPADYIHVGKHSDYFYCTAHHAEILDYEEKRGLARDWMNVATYCVTAK